ncbi:hypothetical protein SAMN05428947_105186 [Mucilaginibacter sp. OK283]|nr:hypothetical protein SAMN05428947_105186 [Mucilaginibacter sp. OK283]
MKNCVLQCMCLIVLCACSHKKQPSAETKHAVKANKPAKTSITNKAQYTNPLFNQYVVFIKSLNLTDPENATKAARRYADLFKGQAPATCDTAFLIFSAYYDKLNNSLDDTHFNRADRSDTILINKVKPGKLPVKVAKYLKQLNDNGFTIIMEEGDTYVGQDRDFIARWFYDSVSPVMKVYLEQLNNENKAVYIEDASIIISAKRLVDREIWWEQFVKDNPGFISIADAAINQKSYLQALLQGTDNTWVMDDKNNLSDYFKDAYSYLLDKYPLSSAAKLVAPYYTFLKEGRRYRADSLMNVYKKEGITG